MTPTEYFLIKMLNEAKVTLSNAQAKFPMDTKYDIIVSRLARQQGEIEAAVKFILRSQEEQNEVIAQLLKNNISDL